MLSIIDDKNYCCPITLGKSYFPPVADASRFCGECHTNT